MGSRGPLKAPGGVQGEPPSCRFFSDLLKAFEIVFEIVSESCRHLVSLDGDVAADRHQRETIQPVLRHRCSMQENHTTMSMIRIRIKYRPTKM